MARCASPDITFHEVPEGPHELFLSQQSTLVTRYVSEWIQSQLEVEVGHRLPASPLKNSGSLVSLTGNPFDWRPRGGSPLGSVYGECFDPVLVNLSSFGWKKSQASFRAQMLLGAFCMCVCASVYCVNTYCLQRHTVLQDRPPNCIVLSPWPADYTWRSACSQQFCNSRPRICLLRLRV